MDFIEAIRDKRNEFESLRDPSGVDIVLRHLDVAERHFERARKAGDSDLFTDVIYRTNQVFEGILKELFIVLSGDEAHRLRPFDIETYLTQNSVFHKRVLDYFSRYRKDWRNPSTHDYRLDFSEQEAFLAISTVSAFCFVAIDEMAKSISSSAAEAKFKGIDRKPIDDVEGLVALIVDRLPQLYEENTSGIAMPLASEAAMLGALEGMLQSSIEKGEVVAEPLIEQEGSKIRPDLVMCDSGKRVIVELKAITNPNKRGIVYRRMVDQLHAYSRVKSSIAVVGIMLPINLEITRNGKFSSLRVEGGATKIYTIFPEGFKETETALS